VVGIFLTRRSVEHASVVSLERQVNLLASRERASLLPFANLPAVRPFLEHQDERLRLVPLKRPSRLLTPQARRLLRKGRTVHGDTTIKGRRYIFAAKAVEQRAIVLLRPATLRPSDWHPFFFGLLIAGLIGALLYRYERDELRRQCPGCGKVVPAYDALCTRCGTELEYPEVLIEPESVTAARR
jgi:hypothetical protein